MAAVIYVSVLYVVLKSHTGLDALVKMKYALNAEKVWSENKNYKLNKLI